MDAASALCIGLVGAEGATQSNPRDEERTIAGAASLIALLISFCSHLRPPEAAGSCVQACEEALKPTLKGTI